MKQILLSIFFILILGFSMVGYLQLLDDDENMVEEKNQIVTIEDT